MIYYLYNALIDIINKVITAMASILLTWLNTEVDLSKKITNMEKDFSNGYLLGELLHKFNQLTNLEEFVDQDNRPAYINNFVILHKVLHNIGVNFTPNIAESIMNCSPGIISNLLYEIRSNWEKKGVNPENISLKKSSHFQEMYSPMKFRQEIPQYDTFENKHFLDVLQMKTRSQKEVDLERKLQKFEDFRKAQEEKIKLKKIEEECEKKNELELNIKKHRNKNQRYHAFLQQFEEKGINNWKNNMLKAKQREINDLQFQLNEANRITRNLGRATVALANDYKKNVDNFEKNVLGKKSKLPGQKKNKSNENNDQQLNVSDNNVNLEENTMNPTTFKEVENMLGGVCDFIYQGIMMDQRTKTERNRRRRKIIVEQGKAQLEIENRRREEQYVNKLAKQSNQEKQLTYEVYRVNQCKEIICENRKLRDEMYLKRNEQNTEFLKFNEDNFLKFHIENFKREIDKEDNRKKDLEISLKQKIRNANSDTCEHLIQLIIDMADKAYVYQQINDEEEIDDRVWREWTKLWVNDKSVLDTEESELHINSKENDAIEHNENEDNENVEQEQEEKAEENSDKKKDNEEPIKENDNKNEEEEDLIDWEGKGKYNNTFYSIFNADAKCSQLDKILDDCEFVDFVNFNGQWQTSIIPETAYKTLTNQDLIFDYVPPQGAEVGNKKEKDNKKNVNAQKGQKDNSDDIIKDEDPTCLIIPKENAVNNYFGDLIDILIEIRYDEENKKLKEEKENFKNIFRYIPLKIVLIGQDFSGKKTQAKILSENYPWKIYDWEKWAAQAMDMLTVKNESQTSFWLSKGLSTNNFPPTGTNQVANQASQVNTSEQINTIAQMRTDQAKDEEKLAYIKELARKIKECWLNGESITDDIYSEWLIEYIKMDFPPKDDFQVIEDIKARVEKKEEIKEDIEKNKEENKNRRRNFEMRDKELNEQLMAISLEASKGFVVVNYPSTYSQARSLEYKLSRYIPENESPKLNSALLKEAFAIILDRSLEVRPPKKLIQSGFDLIFYLDVPTAECIRRAVGRRAYRNPITNEVTVYHLEDNQPSTDYDICENLVKVEDIENCESSLVTRHLAFGTAVNEIVNFYDPFGFEKKGLKSFNIIDGNQGKDYVTQDLLKNVNKWVELNEENDNEVYEREQFEEEEESFDEGNNNISDLKSKINDDILEDGENKLVGHDNSEHWSKKEDKKSKDNKDKSKEENELQQEQSDKIHDSNIEQLSKQHSHQGEVVDSYTEYIQKIETLKATLNKELSEVWLKLWTKLFGNYINECKSIFKFLRVQRESVSSNYNLICQKFIEFLKRPSKKQILLLDYQMKYNKFLDDYPDLKDDPQVKEEHHQEVDDLNDKIYEIIENRKNEAVDERKKIMTSGWIENEMEKFYLALERLFQNEIDKFIGSMQIMRDYYHNWDNRPLIELPFTTIDIIKEEIDPTPIEAFNNHLLDQSNQQAIPNTAVPEQQNTGSDFNLPDSYPRIEKLYRNCLKIQFQYESAIKDSEKARLDKQNETNKKAQTNVKGKKGPGANNQAELEEKEANYAHNDELKKALTAEKTKYKYKITLLKYWGIMCLQNIRKISLSVYNKLEDWIILAIKAENEALEQLTNMLKANIESESKIKYELALDTFDVIVNMDVQNYIELPPQPLPAKEVIDHNKFNILQLKILFEELQTYQIEDSCNIKSSTFISIFIKKYISSKTENDVYYGIPNLLKSWSFYNYFKFIKRLDPHNSDVVSLRQIGTFFALLNCTLPLEVNIKNIIAQLEGIINYYESPEVTKEQFVQLKFWFDENEKSVTLPNHEDYHRDIKLKEVLYDMNKNESDMVNMNELIAIMNLKCIDMNYEKLPGRTYYDVLFF